MRTHRPARTTAQLEADTQATRKQGSAAPAATSVLVDKRASTSANLALQAKMMAGRPVQLQAGEEEELQMKAKEPAQLQAEEEEELQMKAKEPAQLQAEEEEELQMKAKEPAQRQAGDEEELQMKAKGPASKQENNTGMPDKLKSGIEGLSGMSMDHVRVHYNSDKPAQLNAHAYAQGSEIHVAPGQEQHLPHEAWHVVQQKQGRVKPTTQMKGVDVNDDNGLEHEADVMGQKALNNPA